MKIKQISSSDEYELRKTMSSEAWFSAQKASEPHCIEQRRAFICLIGNILYIR